MLTASPIMRAPPRVPPPCAPSRAPCGTSGRAPCRGGRAARSGTGRTPPRTTSTSRSCSASRSGGVPGSAPARLRRPPFGGDGGSLAVRLARALRGLALPRHHDGLLEVAHRVGEVVELLVANVEVVPRVELAGGGRLPHGLRGGEERLRLAGVRVRGRGLGTARGGRGTARGGRYGRRVDDGLRLGRRG